MKRPRFIVVLVLLGTMARPELARANFIDWLQEWSGPGPFKAKWFNTTFTGCVQDRTFRPSPAAMNDKFHQQAERQAHDFVTPSSGYNPASTDYHLILRRILENPDFAFLSSSADVALRNGSIAPEDSPKLNAFTLKKPTLL